MTMNTGAPPTPSQIDPPKGSIVVDISGADQAIPDTTPTCGIYCNVAGTVVAQLRKDAAAFAYVVTAGQLLLGDFSLIKNAGGGTTLTSAQMLALRSRY